MNTLLSNQQRIIKQAKTIEDQGEKKKTIQDKRQVKTINKYTYDAEDTLLILKQK